MKFRRVIVAFLGISISQGILALPKEIYIIRHGDKLEQTYPGPCLSPQGQVRAMSLAFNFLQHFGEPDVIIAANPVNGVKQNESLRELQTVAPLANMLAAKYPNSDFPVLHPYANMDYSHLAQDVLNNPQFNGKTVLICWNHTYIPQLANLLGVKKKLSAWPDADFDSIYLLQFNGQEISKFQILAHQYPVAFSGTWQELYAKVPH